MAGAVRAHPAAPWSVESTHVAFRHVVPESSDTEAMSNAVLSTRGDHHTANNFPPAAARRTDPAHDLAGTTVRAAMTASESGIMSPLLEIATAEPADWMEREDSHTTGSFPPHATAAARTIKARGERRCGIHENSRED
jgi:hypothetical protein